MLSDAGSAKVTSAPDSDFFDFLRSFFFAALDLAGAAFVSAHTNSCSILHHRLSHSRNNVNLPSICEPGGVIPPYSKSLASIQSHRALPCGKISKQILDVTYWQWISASEYDPVQRGFHLRQLQAHRGTQTWCNGLFEAKCAENIKIEVAMLRCSEWDSQSFPVKFEKQTIYIMFGTLAMVESSTKEKGIMHLSHQDQDTADNHASPV